MLNTLLVMMLITISPSSNSVPNFIAPLDFGDGGPDTFGYTWLDSDTSAPGTPTYNWMSIYGVGTQVIGLADDNVVGPFPIGFDFPYYWYTVNSFYIGSNGYISFDDNFNASSPFHAVPSTARPNNVLAPLMSDLDPSVGQASYWYWTNDNNDTLIVEFDSVRFWNRATSNNTFQIILSRPDSTITFQYKEQVGTPNPSWADSLSAIGIENVTGTVGLRYLYEGLPSTNMPHASLAIRFTPPESSAYQVHDVGIYAALSENSGGVFIYNGDELMPWAKVKNTGNQSEANFPVCGLIKTSTGTTIYADTLQAGSMDPGQIDSMAFSPNWIPSSNGLFTFTAKTSLTGDVYPGNDQSIVEMRVVTYPAELQYENVITTTRLYSWNGPGGYGNRFVPPRYPCRVTGMKVYSSATPATDIFVGVLDDNGMGGSPGDTLASATLNVSIANWYTVNFSNPPTITDGAFFIGAISAIASRPSFGMDTVLPMSRQSWEYTTGWAPSRHANIHDACIRALVQAVGIEEELIPTASNISTTVIPNPFRTKTVISFANPHNKTMNFFIYNSIGNRVKTLTTKAEQVVWDGRDDIGKRLADGIYFLKTEDRKETIEKLIITR